MTNLIKNKFNLIYFIVFYFIIILFNIQAFPKIINSGWKDGLF